MNGGSTASCSAPVSGSTSTGGAPAPFPGNAIVHVPPGLDTIPAYPSANTTYILSAGTYTLDRTVNILAGDQFLGAGKDVTIVKRASNTNIYTFMTPQWNFYPYDNINFSDMTIDQNGAGYYSAIQGFGNNWWLHNVHFIHMNSPALGHESFVVYLAINGASYGYNIKNVLVDYCDFDTPMTTGNADGTTLLNITSPNPSRIQATVDHCTFSDFNGAGYLYVNATGLSTTLVTHSTFTNLGVGIYAEPDPSIGNNYDGQNTEQSFNTFNNVQHVAYAAMHPGGKLGTLSFHNNTIINPPNSSAVFAGANIAGGAGSVIDSIQYYNNVVQGTVGSGATGLNLSWTGGFTVGTVTTGPGNVWGGIPAANQIMIGAGVTTNWIQH
jgi:hypothetical protein